MLEYLLKREPCRSVLRTICDLLEVVSTSHDEVIAAIDNSDFKDFEDCVQTKCAKSAQADYIITRNTNDFKLSEIAVLTPKELFEIVDKR